ncbi:MAG: hypothetical protein COV72_07080 [Candidatus Omnitrophica bacterium CG11_big_fil_rev_8_21_14_0_20_42_13]|uniref:Prepilin-type N-terminal cleavage/methylation domain-containing protein n=1 Tax=Candidatus Ghiorseimicrobium undicola TaxID=1974746 RepID=A0A2H0LYD4_9BACT|nr:MAG: hypothetical protein COV72_07080 [Candidatus Omnitrophica bacterium CG11_big_fil_rev_8_21_14_0_20_42_13]
MFSRRGFTLLELIIVVIIIAILAGVALPQYIKSVERAKAGKAVNALGIIRQAENLYRAANDTYIDISSGGYEAALGNYVEMVNVDADTDWAYDVTGSGPDTFLATASRNTGPYAGESITIDQDGVIDWSGWSIGP